LGFHSRYSWAGCFDVGAAWHRTHAACAIAPNAATPLAAAPLAAPVDRPPVKPSKVGTAIAVLPFVNMSGDPENEYFSDGIARKYSTFSPSCRS
jgi:hypothetical protein